MSRSRDKSPAYQWYPKDYQSDSYVIAMSLEQEGAYRRLLDVCWLEHGLPKNYEQLWRLAKCRSRQHFERLWPGIKPKFYEREGRLHNRRLDRERRQQAEHRKNRQRAAAVRWGRKPSMHVHPEGPDQVPDSEKNLAPSGPREDCPQERTRGNSLTRRKKTSMQCISNADALECSSSASSSATAVRTDQDHRALRRGISARPKKPERLPFAHYCRIAREAFEKSETVDHNTDLTNVTEWFKQLCAQANVSYDGEIVRKAIDAVDAARARGGSRRSA